MNPKETAAEILALYKQFGDADYIGEPVSQTEHMSQCAQLAMASGADNEMVLAAFFHDIGHLCEHIMPVQQMDGFGVVNHEALGASYLRQKGFSERMAKLVASHVDAKRYLTFADADYYTKLSAASRHTLALQGGVMTAQEAANFEADPLHKDYIQLRRWDEQAKLEQQPLVPFELMAEKIIELLTN
ncbi:MAG: HDIG domain-containing protein [Bacteroidetes bacterium]|nr:MAG: HDIG domain-containing protein [Bacteroidota bacterium]